MRFLGTPLFGADGTQSKATGRLLAGVLFVALLARVGAMVALEAWVFPEEQAFGWEEGEIAYALVNGQG